MNKRIYFISTVVGLNALSQMEYDVTVHAPANSTNKGIIGGEDNSHFLVSLPKPEAMQYQDFVNDLRAVMNEAVKGNTGNHFRFR